MERMLQLLVKIAQDAARPEVVDAPGLPQHQFYLRNADGILELKAAPRSPRKYVIDDLADFGRAVSHFAEEGAAVVFCGETAISAVLDEPTDARNRLDFPLTYTPEFTLLDMLARSRNGKTQREFVSMLRVDLARAVDKTIVEAFRSLEFKKNEEGQSKMAHGDEAIGHSIKRAVLLNGQSPPEDITATIRIYEQLDDESPIRCAVDLDLETVTFTLIPLGGELQNAKRTVRENVRNRLRDAIAGQQVFYGSA